MFCEECGKKLIRPQALYCPYCGHKVNHGPVDNQVSVAQSGVTQPKAPVSPEPPVETALAAATMPELKPIYSEPTVSEPVTEVPAAEEIPAEPVIPEPEPIPEPVPEPTVSEPVTEVPAAEEIPAEPVIPEPEPIPEPVPEPTASEPVMEAPAAEETTSDLFADQSETDEDMAQEMQPFEPDFPDFPSRYIESSEEPVVPELAPADEPEKPHEVHNESAPEPVNDEPEKEEYISTASAFTSFELEEIQRNLKKKITPEPLFDKEKLAAELYNNLYENLYENLKENIKREVLRELEEEKKDAAGAKKSGFFKRR